MHELCEAFNKHIEDTTQVDGVGNGSIVDQELDDEYRPVWAVPPEPRPLPIDWKFFACVAFVAAIGVMLR